MLIHFYPLKEWTTFALNFLHNLHITVIMKHQILYWSAGIATISIIAVVAMQAYWVKQTLDVKEKEFHQTASIALMNVAQAMATYNRGTLPVTEILKQISSNYYVVNLNDVIDANVLEHYLQREFNKLALNTDFEYGIYDCNSDKMLYGNYCEFNETSKTIAKPSSDLPAYDKFIYYFGVKFPDKNFMMLSELKNSIIFSFITLIAILCLIYVLFALLKQQRLSNMQKDFINNMTHEFKTPISSINIASDAFLKDKEVQQNLRLLKYATIIKSQNAKLNNHVEKILNIAKLDKDHLVLDNAQLDLNEIIQDEVSNLKLRFSDKDQISINITTNNTLVLGDELHISNCIKNILDNAYKYKKQHAEIQLTLDESNNNIVLTIHDKGIGINSEHLSKIRDKFYRVPKGNLHNVKGFGLGLFYVDKMIKRHGWKMDIDSKEGKFTEIKIKIPK